MLMPEGAPSGSLSSSTDTMEELTRSSPARLAYLFSNAAQLPATLRLFHAYCDRWRSDIGITGNLYRVDDLPIYRVQDSFYSIHHVFQSLFTHFAAGPLDIDCSPNS